MNKIIAQGILGGFILFFIILGIVFATGSTFGQRCAEEYTEDSQEWCDCVDRLSQGGPLIKEDE